MRTRWIFHPISIFIFSLLALGSSLFLYIHWYLKVNDRLLEFVHKYKLDENQIFKVDTWVIILTLSILVGIILVGILLIFIYYQKMIALYRQQQNFINGFTHELKTPIASIKLYLETFTKHQLPREEQLKYLKYMSLDADRLSYNVNRILNLAKIEDKNYSSDFYPAELVSTIQEIIKKNAHLYDEEKVEVVARENEAYDVSINNTLFEILVTNLITNGLTHNNQNSPKVSINFSQKDKWLKISFKDNGRGIPRSEFKYIFRKFYQVGKVSKGSGLGLFLVQQISRIHKGHVQVESDGPGKGTTFHIFLPISRERNDEQ